VKPERNKCHGRSMKVVTGYVGARAKEKKKREIKLRNKILKNTI
jgi:hypothetical protein